MNRRTAALRAGAALLTASLLMGIAGCSAPEQASDLPEPLLTWPDGEPVGELNATPQVSAVRDSRERLGTAILWGDFSDPDLVSVLGYDEALRFAQHFADERFIEHPSSAVLRGMRNSAEWAHYFEAISVTHHADGTSTVDGCGMLLYGLGVRKTHERWVVSPQPDGRFKADLVYETPDALAECEGVTVHGALRDPAFDLDSVTRDSVKMPLPREYYIDLGVISE